MSQFLDLEAKESDTYSDITDECSGSDDRSSDSSSDDSVVVVEDKRMAQKKEKSLASGKMGNSNFR